MSADTTASDGAAPDDCAPERALQGLAAAADAFDRSPVSPRRVGEWAFTRLLERQRAAATADPEWASIEQRKRPDGTVVLSEDFTLDDLARQRAIEESLAPASTTTRALLRLRHLEASPMVGRLQKAISRVRRGWAPEDTWSLDGHLCRTLGEMLIYLADHVHGGSSEPEYPTAEDWREALRSNGSALLHYDIHDDRAYAEAQQALRWVADNLGAIWD